MKIAVLGTIVKDRIVAFDKQITESLGGLFYSIETLRALCAPDDQILPISFVGSDIYAEVVNRFAGDSRIMANGLYRIEQPNNRVELRYTSPHERVEYSMNPMPSLPFEKVEPFLDADMMIVNFISGWDIELLALKRFAKKFHGVLSMDVHSLTMGRESDGKRVLRKIENLQEWMQIPDIIQFNKQEFQMICSSGPISFYKKYCFDQNKIVNLTLGHRGSLSLFREKNEIVRIETPAAEVDVIDPTGCGDVFLAAFGCAYGKSKNIINAAKTANLAAGLAGSIKGLPGYSWLSENVKKFREIDDA